MLYKQFITIKGTKAHKFVKMRRHLINIDIILNKLEKIDVYGDIIENFCEDKTKRHTTRLIKMIEKDLNKMYSNKTQTN